MFSVIGLNEDIYIHPSKNKKGKEVKKKSQWCQCNTKLAFRKFYFSNNNIMNFKYKKNQVRTTINHLVFIVANAGWCCSGK